MPFGFDARNSKRSLCFSFLGKVSHNALVFSRSTDNKRRGATTFSQRLLVKFDGYRATIQVTAISSVFRFLCYLLVRVFNQSTQVFICYSYLLILVLLKLAFTRYIIAKAYCQATLVGQ